MAMLAAGRCRCRTRAPPPRWSRARRCAGRTRCDASTSAASTASASVDPHADGQDEPRRLRKGDEQVVDPGGRHVDRLLVREPLRDAARDAEHAERDDERHDAERRDHHAVDDADHAAGRRRRRAARAPAAIRLLMPSAVMTPVSAIVAPTDRSMPPLTMIIVMPIAPSADDDRLREDDAQVERRQVAAGRVGQEAKTRTIAISPSAGPMRTIQRRTRAGATSDRSTPSSVGAPAG